ncbi:MAG: class I SAM-dependent methyltransferase [Patescibacteria group bacterium]|nr:class I SAM-dependent methyltransferase [Patescibacteria group bacterium]MDD4304379.1 class I SAM-dependent methyltransferase [Patescibacteria group bacterium]MDD4695402.1 class I SAM-dependent methyltransferase [Patescibacteria group bacterium]
MKEDEINKQYWSNEKPEKILAGVYFPGEELTKFIKMKSTILDVGCGSGKVSEYLHKKNYIVTGIDINKNALKENNQRNSNITYIKADITERLPFNDSTFDAITVPYVFVSIIDKEEAQYAATELIRVLKTNGILWLCEATYSKDYEERYKIGKELTGLKNIATAVFSDGPDKGKVQRFIHHYSGEEMDEIFQSLTKLSSKQLGIISPSSGMKVQTIITVYKKV